MNPMIGKTCKAKESDSGSDATHEDNESSNGDDDQWVGHQNEVMNPEHYKDSYREVMRNAIENTTNHTNHGGILGWKRHIIRRGGGGGGERIAGSTRLSSTTSPSPGGPLAYFPWILGILQIAWGSSRWWRWRRRPARACSPATPQPTCQPCTKGLPRLDRGYRPERAGAAASTHLANPCGGGGGGRWWLW
jgi:hypothetical protein